MNAKLQQKVKEDPFYNIVRWDWKETCPFNTVFELHNDIWKLTREQVCAMEVDTGADFHAVIVLPVDEMANAQAHYDAQMRAYSDRLEAEALEEAEPSEAVVCTECSDALMVMFSNLKLQLFPDDVQVANDMEEASEEEAAHKRMEDKLLPHIREALKQYGTGK